MHDFGFDDPARHQLMELVQTAAARQVNDATVPLLIGR